MTFAQENNILVRIGVLEKFAEKYPGKTIENIIQQEKSIYNELKNKNQYGRKNC